MNCACIGCERGFFCLADLVSDDDTSLYFDQDIAEALLWLNGACVHVSDTLRTDDPGEDAWIILNRIREYYLDLLASRTRGTQSAALSILRAALKHYSDLRQLGDGTRM